MARSRRTRRQQVYGERKKKRPGRRPTVAELARKEKVIAALTPPTIKGKQDVLKPGKIRFRGRKTTKDELPAGPREILIVSRKGQPQIFTQIEPLEKRNYPTESISSSWLSTYGYFFYERIGTFTTRSGRQYKIFNLDFETWEKWYYAHSKGTFFNEFIKEQYTIRGTL